MATQDVSSKASSGSDFEVVTTDSSNQKILDLLLEMQSKQAQIEERISQIEQGSGSVFPGTRKDETFVGAIDQGTTSTRFLIFNKDGEPVATHQIEFKQIYPNSGYHHLAFHFA